MSNPWKRDTLARVPVPVRYQDLDGRALAARCAEDWAIAAEEPIDPQSFMTTALRIRDGARAACKRLRGERDDARGHYRWMVEHAADQKLDGYRELGARAAAAENERDAARLELRALEWMLHQQPGRFDLVCSINMAARVELPLRRALEHEGSYASAATALGWEG